MTDIKILPLAASKKKTKFSDETKLVFGKMFTDRMFFAEWTSENGWFNAQIKPYAAFLLDPSSLVFHYGQEIFEGLKAYAWADQTIALFRPEMNIKRFNLSAMRLCMPTFPEKLFMKALETLIYLERDWIPTSEGTSLYIRPTMIAVENVLGVRPSSHYYFYIILSPVGAYYASGFNPTKIWIEERYVRAVAGGLGEAKTGANYAASLKATLEAKEKGFDQVLWLDAIHHRYVEEVGAMNIFFVYEDYVITAPLQGSILHGITRDSVITLLKSFGIQIREQPIDIHTLIEDIRHNRVKEAFGSGTAAVITPVGSLGQKNELYTLNNNQVGPLTQKLYHTLSSIQSGSQNDPFGWIRKINPPTKKHHVN